MTTPGEVRALLTRSALLQGEADELGRRAMAAAWRGEAFRAWELEQAAGRLLTEARGLVLRAETLIEQQRVAEQVFARVRAICAAALVGMLLGCGEGLEAQACLSDPECPDPAWVEQLEGGEGEGR